MRAFVLVHVLSDRADQVVTAVRALKDVIRAEVVSGPYDVVVTAEASRYADLVREILEPIRATPGVVRIVVCPVAEHHSFWEMGEEPALVEVGTP